MMDYEVRTSPMGRSFSNPLHLREVSLNSTGDESMFPTSTLSPHSDCNSSSDSTSISWTARSGNSTNFLEDSVFGRLSLCHTDEKESTILRNWRKDQSIIKPSWANFKSSKEQVSRRTPPISRMFQMEQSNPGFMPITATNFFSQRSRSPIPGISKMLLSLRDHSVERPCTANASTLYQNTRTHCNPSELGQQTHDECMVFTKWANKLLQQSQDQFLITDLARDMGDGLTLLSLAGMLVGEYPPQVHIKPALDVQKIENVRTCLDFLEYYDVPVQDIAAVDIVKGNLKVVLALCHCLYRCFSPCEGSLYSSVHHLTEHNGVELFGWVSQVTGEPVTGFQSFEDGTVLCLLVNRILSNSVPDLVLKFGSPAEKVSSALKVSVEQLGIVTSIHADDIIKQSGQEKFLEFLNSLYLTYLRNTKTVQVDRSGSEGGVLKRELKKLQTRDEKGKDNPLGSRLTYLGESSESRSLFSDYRLRCCFMKETGVPPAETEMTKQELSGFSNTSPVAVSDVKLQNGTLNNTKRELDQLEKELRLLQLDYKSVQGGLLDHQSRASRHLQSPTSLLVRNARHINDEKTELSPVLTYHSDEVGGKLSFGSLTQERRLHVKHQSVEDSFVFKEHQAKPSFLEKTTASTQRKSCETVTRNRNEQDSFGEEVRTSVPQRSILNSGALDNCQLPQNFLAETKGVSNIFDVEFSDLDATLRNDREDKAVKRMLHVGKKIILDSTERESFESIRCGTGGCHSKGQQEPQRKPPTGQQWDTLSESRRFYGSSCDTLNFSHELVSNFSTPSGKKESYKESKNEFASFPSSSKSDPLNKPLAKKQFGTRNGIEPACHLQRTLSNEKRHRKEVLVKKSARHSRPSSLKANTHALTALIRMSAKNAGASLSEED